MAKEKASSRASSTMSHGSSSSKKSKKSSKKKGHGHPVHKMHIRRAANGGYIAEHMFKPTMNEAGQMEAPENEEHQIGGLDELQQHVGEHMGPPEEAPGGAPAPAAAPAPTPGA